ncbi:uncharacterized protein [Littorina saxatilis]|uniref:uncharacterized protein n=1 Tax=Littorina saxatilis TaxID=31220 RepID=UPI0038B53D28
MAEGGSPPDVEMVDASKRPDVEMVDAPAPPDMTLWRDRISEWFPDYLHQTYFLPPVHMRKTEHEEKKLQSGMKVLVTKEALTDRPKGLGPVLVESDVRDDQCQQTVLDCLRRLSQEKKEENVGMFVLSQLKFGHYLNKPAYMPAAESLPRPTELKIKNIHQGDFDMLVIHRQHGVLVGEIKAVGDMQSFQSQAAQDGILSKKIEQAISQLQKADEVMKHVTKDIKAPSKLLKTVMLPNIKRADLQRVLKKKPTLMKELCICLDLNTNDDPAPLCLTSDDVSNPGPWWQCRMTNSGKDPAMTDDAYLELISRFGGPATTVKVFCSSAPRLAKAHRSDVRTKGEGVTETGNRFTPVDIVLHPGQVQILDNPDMKLVYLTGPPGTGKSLVLLLKAADWLRKGKFVDIVSFRKESLAASFALESQLKQMEPNSSHLVRLHTFNLPGDASRALLQLTGVDQKQKMAELFVIFEEAWNCYSDAAPLRHLCVGLNKRVVNLHLWTASLHPKTRPQLLNEVVLTAPLRTPPCVTQVVAQHRGFIGQHVYCYSNVPTSPVPCDGPPPRDVFHKEPQHTTGTDTPDCRECGREIAEILKELQVGKPAKDENSPQPPRNRDVFILTCGSHFHDCRKDTSGNVTSPARGLVQGVIDGGFPVKVLDLNDTKGIREVATMTGPDCVIAADSIVVNGLERKIIIFVQHGGLEYDAEDWGKLWAISRCTAQLVWLRPQKIHVPSCAPLKYSDRERVAESPSDAGKVDTPNDMSSKEEKDLTNQGACRIDGSNDNPPPIMSMSWQHKGTFGHTGGVLRKPGSDVILHVPTQALGPDNPVVIHTAVCADIDHVHTVLELAHEEQIVSPLAEYWAGLDFSFQRPVCITLPLCLPPDPDLSLLRVYRVSRRQDGHVTLTSIKLQENNLSDCPSGQQEIGNAHSVAGESYVLCKDREKTEEADTDSDCSHRGSIPLDNKYQHSEGQRQHVGYAWEESGHYEVSSEGQVLVTTDHFCGYVCVYCGRSQGPPELVAMVYGRHEKMSSLQRLASVDLYIWDKRVDIGDFRQEYDIGLTGSKVGRTAVSLLDEVKDTQLHAQIETLGPASSNWTHLQRPDGRPGNPHVQNRDVKMIVSCDAYGCTRKKSAPPSLVQWRLVAPVDLVTGTSLFAVLDLAHVMDDAVPAWTNRNNAERITSLQIHMPESRGNEDVNEPEGHNLQLSLAAFSTDQLQMVLERIDFASCQRLQQTTQRFKRKEDYKKQLMELCCHQDSTTVGKVIASLFPCAPGHGPASLNLQPPLGNCSPATTPANGGPQNREISPLAGMSLPNGSFESQMASTGVSDGSDWNCSNHDKHNMTSESGNAKKGSTSVPGEELILWQDINHTLPLLPSNININGNKSSGNGIIEKAVRESHITADQDGNYSGYTVQSCARSFSGIPLSQVNGLNCPQDSQLTLTGSQDAKEDAIFDHIDKDIIVRVAKLLPVDKAMLFFLDLGLSSQQYEAAKHKHGTAFEHVNTECFIMLGQASQKIDVDTLTKALDTIDRFDISKDVHEIVNRKKSKMRSPQETGPGKTLTDSNTTEEPPVKKPRQ